MVTKEGSKLLGQLNTKDHSIGWSFVLLSFLGLRRSNKLLRPKGGTGESPKGFPRGEAEYVALVRCPKTRKRVRRSRKFSYGNNIHRNFSFFLHKIRAKSAKVKTTKFRVQSYGCITCSPVIVHGNCHKFLFANCNSKLRKQNIQRMSLSGRRIF